MKMTNEQRELLTIIMNNKETLEELLKATSTQQKQAKDLQMKEISLVKGLKQSPGRGVYPRDLSVKEFHEIINRMLDERLIDDVKQILLYMESIQNPANFRKLASRITKKKPILALKAGRSAAGASAASSHTGSLAGADKAAAALLKQSGFFYNS